MNAICPGLIRTPLTEQYFAEDAFEEGLRTVVPQGRVGVADDVADAALYLASDQSAYVNGIALTVDGGLARGEELRGGGGGRVGVPRLERDEAGRVDSVSHDAATSSPERTSVGGSAGRSSRRRAHRRRSS